jgi:hypothetical protein
MNSNSSQPTGANSLVSTNQDAADLWQQMSEMKAEMENYKAEVANLRQEIAFKEAKENGLTYHPLPAPSRRQMLKRMVVGAAGLSALSLAAVASSNTVFAETTGDTAVDAASGPGGYGGKFTSTFAQLQLVPAGALPTSFTGRNLGEMFVDSTGALYYAIATTGTTPNAWRKIAGPGTAGTLNLLPASDRFVDTRPGSQVGTVGTRIVAGATTAVTLQITGFAGRDGTTIPTGATAITGNVTILPVVAGVTPVKIVPSTVTNLSQGTATVIYNGAIISNSFSAALSPAGAVKVIAPGSGSFDVTIDIVGYFS